MKTERQTKILNTVIEILQNIENSTDIDAPYHISDIDNDIETLTDDRTLSSRQGEELNNKLQALLNFVVKVK
jgi:hypothetical protein